MSTKFNIYKEPQTSVKLQKRKWNDDSNKVSIDDFSTKKVANLSRPAEFLRQPQLTQSLSQISVDL